MSKYSLICNIYYLDKYMSVLKKIKILYFLVPLLIFTSCSKEKSLETQTQIALGTVCSIQLESDVSSQIYNNCFQILSDVEKELSRTRSDSYISILNRDKYVQVNQEVFDLFKFAISLAKQSNGKFNIAMGEVISLWDIGGDNPRVPSEEELTNVNIDYNQIKLNEADLSIEIPNDMEVDFGALGKGYAADKLKSYLESENIDKAIINLGGNVLVIGEKDKNTPWSIGLQDPDDVDNIYSVVKVKDSSIVTSGTYERFFYQDGVKYHHILDPETLYPCESDIISSTIIGESSLICDSLSTTCFLLGSSQAIEFMKNYEGYNALLLLEDGSIVTSDGFNIEFKLIDN